MASATHPRKHDINSDTDHIKKRLDLEGDENGVSLSIANGTKFNFALGSNYENDTWFKWVDEKQWLEFGHCIKVDGSLNLEGEASIIGGSQSKDSLSFYPNQSRDTPNFTFEGQTEATFFLSPTRVEYFKIESEEYNPKEYFWIRSGSNPALSIGYDLNTTIYMKGYVDTIFTHQIYAGDNTSDYLYIDGQGNITLYGAARQEREIINTTGDIVGNAATYNGVSCSAAGEGIINDAFQSMTLNGGTGWTGGPEAFITTFTVPADYDEGTEITIVIHYTSDTTSGSAVIGVGTSPAHDSYNQNFTYSVKTIPAPSTAYDRAVYEYDFTISSLKRGDEIAVVVYRDPDDSNDTMSGDAMITGVGFKYVANQIGGRVS